MRAKTDKGVYTQPDLINFFVERPTGDKAESVVANIVFKFIGRPPLQWENNGKDLRQPRMGLSIVLDPTNWPKESAR
jgi:hypothetical protein